MLNKIIEFSIKNKLIIGLFVLGLIAFGSYELKHLPIDAVPDITDNQVQIITTAPDLGATDIERLITFPIEEVNNNIPGIEEIRSFSRFGLSVVTIVFDEKTDIYWARQQVSERLIQVQEDIPSEFGTPELAPVTTGLGEIYQYVLRPEPGYEDKYDAMALRTIQDWDVRRQLISVKGVAEVSSFGGFLKQYEIAVEPERLLAHNISIIDVFEALESNNQNTGGAYIEKGPTVLFIKSEGLVGTLNDIEQIPVKRLTDGTPLLIKDIGKVQIGSATRYGAMTYNDGEQVAGAIVMMLKGANSNEVIKNIKERIEEIQKTLPEGVVIEPFLDRTKMVNNAINTVTKNLAEGALIVVFILVLFLGNFRAGLLVASVIPLAMLFAVIMMNIFGVSGNLMSLGALDFGLIVDGAVIIVEAVLHGFHKRFNVGKSSLAKEEAQAIATNQDSAYISQAEMDAAVGKSATKMMNSAVFGQIIILIVYLPILTLQGIEGKMFKPMAQTVTFALIGAFLLSLTYIPMMSSWILSKKREQKATFSDRIMDKVENLYQRMLIKAFRLQKTILSGVLALFVVALFMFSRLGGEFIPSLPEGDFAVETVVLSGSNLNTSIEAVSKASRILLDEFPEVEKVVSKTGDSEVPTDPMAMNESDMMIILKPRKEWVSATNYDDLEAKMSKALEAVPGVYFGLQYPVAMRFNELMSGAKQDVVCKIFGDDLDTLAYYANKLGQISASIEGSEALYIETVTGVPQITVNYNRATIAQYGLNIQDVNQAINTAFAGKKTGMVYEGEKRFDMVVRLSNEKRKDLTDVQNLLISTPSGVQIPLSAVADVSIIEGPNQIQRENSRRRIIVGFNVRGRDIQSTVHELQEKTAQQLRLPAGYYIDYGGEFENLEAAKDRLLVAVPIALLLIFILLYFAFKSIKLGILIYTAIPLSTIGGVFALTIRDMPFSISAGIGFIALFGVAVLNGIILIAEFNRLKKEGHTDIVRNVIRGAKSRIRPVLMTAAVASLGFLPMATSLGEGAEVQRPLATVVIGGLFLATLLTLFVLPILYIIFNKGLTMKHKSIKGLAAFILLFISMNANAQTPITLQQAIDTALVNNLAVKNEKLRTDYHQKLIRSGVNIPATEISGEYGQMNSFYSDLGLGLSQTLSFPKVYSSQKDLLAEEWKSSVLNLKIKETELKKSVTEVYFNLLYIQQKKKLLLENDRLFSEFLTKSKLRFEKGESNILEKATAENQRGQIALQLSQLGQDWEIVQLHFQYLLNTTAVFVPDESETLSLHTLLLNNPEFDSHPLVQYWKQQENIAAGNTQIEKLKRLPDITFGYNIMGMRGMGADDVEYNSSLRFHSFQFGLGIPIFNTGQRSKIKASKINEQIAMNEYEENLKNLEINFTQAMKQYQKYQEAVNYFENIALENAEMLKTTANNQFLNGEINYLEWVLLTNQAIGIQSEYIEAIQNRNKAIAEVNFYLNK